MCQLVPMLLISQLSAHLYAEDRPLDCSQWKTWLFFMSVLIFRWGQALFRFGSIFLENSCFQTIIFLSIYFRLFYIYEKKWNLKILQGVPKKIGINDLIYEISRKIEEKKVPLFFGLKQGKVPFEGPKNFYWFF